LEVGAVTRQQIANSLDSKFVGHNVDLMLAEFGAPYSMSKMNSGDTAYMWQLTSATNTKGGDKPQFCKINAVATSEGIVSSINAEDAHGAWGESLCVKRLGLDR
jgi:hypothetical protein